MRRILAAAAVALGGVLVFAAPAQAEDPAPCEAYVYAGTKQNLCDRFASASEVDCKDVKWRVSLVGDNDPWRLDNRGKTGVGCEANPVMASNSPAPGAGAVAGGGGKAEASLPVTGASVPVLGGVAALLLVGGGAAVLLARRRRTRFTA